MAALGPSGRVVVTSPKVLRESHYRILTLAALGYTNVDIAERLGYTRERVGQIISAPASQSEIERLRGKIEDKIIADDLAAEEALIDRQTKLVAKRQRLEMLHDHEANGTFAAAKDYNSIIADLEDRYGTPRKSTNVNLAADFGSALEEAIARSDAVRASQGVTLPERLP